MTSELIEAMEAHKTAAEANPQLYRDGWECAMQCAINIVRQHEAAHASRQEAATGQVIELITDAELADHDPAGDAYAKGYADGFYAKAIASEQQRTPSAPLTLTEEERREVVEVMRDAIWQNRNRDALNKPLPVNHSHGDMRQSRNDAKAALTSLLEWLNRRAGERRRATWELLQEPCPIVEEAMKRIAKQSDPVKQEVVDEDALREAVSAALAGFLRDLSHGLATNAVMNSIRPLLRPASKQIDAPQVSGEPLLPSYRTNHE